jgi:small subunit ribosomal protein S20
MHLGFVATAIEIRTMAHHTSAKKRIRGNARRAEVNTNRVSRIRTFVKRVETAITSGDKTAAQSEFRLAQPELQRGATRGVLHFNTVSRKISRLSARIKAMG